MKAIKLSCSTYHCEAVSYIEIDEWLIEEYDQLDKIDYWICPVCNHTVYDFEKVTIGE